MANETPWNDEEMEILRQQMAAIAEVQRYIHDMAVKAGPGRSAGARAAAAAAACERCARVRLFVRSAGGQSKNGG